MGTAEPALQLLCVTQLALVCMVGACTHLVLLLFFCFLLEMESCVTEAGFELRLPASTPQVLGLQA